MALVLNGFSLKTYILILDTKHVTAITIRSFEHLSRTNIYLFLQNDGEMAEEKYFDQFSYHLLTSAIC